MIDALVFSRDRPAQLDLLLRSVGVYAPCFYGRIVVLWHASTEAFEAGYRKLIGEAFYPRVEFGREAGFEDGVRLWLGEAGEVISFLCDDDVFYRPAPDLERAELPLRLPLSIRGGDTWYPFSVDGNVYRHGEIVRLLDGLSFSDPTQLEHAGHLHRRRLPFAQTYQLEPPCLVGLPWNRVSPTSGMPHAGLEPATLLERYLAGERLAIPTVPDGVRLTAHAFLPAVWESVGVVA